jgi:DNA replication licensing factor MCM4
MVSLSAYNKLVDVSKLGDCLIITRVSHSMPVQVNPQCQMIKSLFKMFLDSMGPHK